MSNETKYRQNHDGRNSTARQLLDQQSLCRRQAYSDRSCISVFTEQCSNQQNGAWQCYARDSEEAESQRLISIAKTKHLFIEASEIDKLGDLYSKKTGESRVYANEEMGLVFKVRDPYAKRVLKDLHPSDVIYEHIVHNILFPNARYSFFGITTHINDLRIILSQEYCKATLVPSDDEIELYLGSMGLVKEDRYYFGNEYLAITDVGANSDNVLKDDQGQLYFIDPIIKFKKPAPIVIDWLLSDDCPMWKDNVEIGNSPKQSLLERILSLFSFKSATCRSELKTDSRTL